MFSYDFRLWDKKNGTLIKSSHVSSIDLKAKSFWVVPPLKGGVWLKEGDVNVLPYIGMTDKNKTKIYLSDIVKTTAGVGTVVYVADYRQLGYYVSVGGNLYNILSPYNSFELEVVGNIFQHGHLLDLT